MSPSVKPVETAPKPVRPRTPLATLLRNTRLALGLTIDDWCRELRVGHRTVAGWEASETTPRESTLLLVREVLRRHELRQRLTRSYPAIVAELGAAGLWA